MIDPDDPPQLQIEKQAKIIDALIRRAKRQKDVGPSAYRAFQSAIELQQQVAAKNLELESARDERARTERTLAEALASMEEGLAHFANGKLNICNQLFRGLLPDISDKLQPGVTLAECFRLVANSRHLVSTDREFVSLRRALGSRWNAGSVQSMVIEVASDHWYQMSVQQTSPQNTVLLLTEITHLMRHNRREKESLIDQQADYLQAVFQNMTAGVCTFSADGEVMMQNRRFRDLLGVPLAILQPGTPLQELLDFLGARDLVTDESLLRFDAWHGALIRNGALTARVVHGGRRVLDARANMLLEGGFLIELQDVTLETRSTEILENRVMERTAELTRANASLMEQYEDKARVEEELRLAKERAEAAVSSKTRFLAAASHDLLQPINAAKLMISSLQEMTQETDFLPMVERLEGVFSSAEYLLHSLLDISRLESADPDTVSITDVDLGNLIRGVNADQSLLAARKSVRLDVVPCNLVVRSDPVYLLRSIQNLVVNAIQYTEPGGRVLVGCRRRGAAVVLEVWDTGIGISAKDQPRIFEEFTRAGNVPIGSGMGLGLSVVDRACRLLGHALRLRSKPGRGSVFSMEMELADAKDARAKPQAPMQDRFDAALDHIVMMIENDADVLYGTTHWLELHGAGVLPARSTAEALTHVTEIGMPPDVILADYQLDDDDTGVLATQAIRKATGYHVPAILITADRSEAVRNLAIINDMSVMTKPAKLARLRALIDWKICDAGLVPDTDKSRR